MGWGFHGVWSPDTLGSLLSFDSDPWTLHDTFQPVALPAPAFVPFLPDAAMLFFNPIKTFFKALRGDGTPNQLAMGGCLGIMLGILPPGSMVWFITLLILLLFNVNFTMAVIAWLVFKGLAVVVLDDVTWSLGRVIVEDLGANGEGFMGSLVKSLATVGLHQWWHMGAVALSLVAFIPMYFLFRLLFAGLRRYLIRILTSKWYEGVQENWFLNTLIVLFLGDIAEMREDFEEDHGELKEEIEGEALAEEEGEEPGGDSAGSSPQPEPSGA